jgi:hypothetical protein
MDISDNDELREKLSKLGEGETRRKRLCLSVPSFF